MPKPPSWLTKVNFVTEFISNPCQASWYLYFETAKIPAGKFAVALLSFGLDDVIRGYFRPKNLRSQRHLRRGKKGKVSKFGIPEIGELVAEKLPGAKAAKGRVVAQGVKNLWIIDNALQRVLFWWMIVDITTDFFYAWFSAIQKENFCRLQHLAGFGAIGQNIEVLGIAGWQGATCASTFEQGGATFGGLNTGTVPAGMYTAVFAATVETEPLIGADEIRARIIVAGPWPHISEVAVATLSLGTTSDIVCSTYVKGPALITFEVGTFSGNAICVEQHCFAGEH